MLDKVIVFRNDKIRIRREDKTLQYKNKKNLYKIVFITILLGFIISLVGCGWFPNGLFGIFNPSVIIRTKSTEINEDGTIDLSLFTLNKVEFMGSGFDFEYFDGTIPISYLDRTDTSPFYIDPDSSYSSPISISGIPLYSPQVLAYVRDNEAFNKITCNVYIVGKDGATYDIKEKITGRFPALGVDNTLPKADISIEPDPDEGPFECPLMVIFDGSGSNDGDGIGIAKYEWYLPQISIISTDMSFSKELSCSLIIPATDSGEVITVSLTVTDYHGNKDTAASSVSIKN